MPLKRRNLQSYRHLSVPVSYKMLDKQKMYDAKNVYDNKGITSTRYGIERYNTTSLGGSVLSLSYFKSNAGTRYKVAKVGTVLYSVAASGAATSIKTGLSSTTKHRAVTLKGRHIICIEGDGLFSWDGTTFTQLGQAVPSAPTISASGTGLTNSTYAVCLTFYASSIGFETNASANSNEVATSSQGLSVTGIPTTASNALIDKVRVYLQDITTNGSKLFITELSLGTSTYSITDNSSSTQTPPITHGAVTSGGGKYPTAFGRSFAYAGNGTYLSDVFISEEDLPDAFDDGSTSRTLNIDGQGPITGIACGLFNDSDLAPYLAIFKKTSTTIYSELGGEPQQVLIDEHVGCVSHDTIRVKNGIIYFMSENGWYRIYNGALVKNENNEPESLGNGDIDDVFSRAGWEYELNKSQFTNFFSVYYPTLNHYMTFVCEGSNSDFTKAYVYEMAIKGFRPFEFKTAMKCAVEGEDDSGNQVIFMADATGQIFHYSVENEIHDVNASGTEQSIETFCLIPWLIEDDFDSSYNYRQLLIRALTNSETMTVRAFFNFNLQDLSLHDYDFTDPNSGFVLDVSELDVGVFGDSRTVVTKTADISRTAESILIGFYQDAIDANINLISAQLHFNKNGNRNL